MKTKQLYLRLAVCGTVLALMLTVCSPPPLMSFPRTPAPIRSGTVDVGGHEPALQCRTALPVGGETPSGCTVFTVAKGKKVFFGGNDDWITPDSYYWVDPGSAQGYGAIWVGTPDNVQQGINERGLAYDANGLPRVNVNPHPSASLCRRLHQLPHQHPARVRDGGGSDCLGQYAPVAFLHARPDAICRRYGGWVIISAGADGEVAFARKPRGDGYLVSSNFNVADPANSYSYPCWRYTTAQQRLDRLINQEGELIAQDVARVLDAVHEEGGTSWTIESLVADLPNGIVYLYYYYQFDKPVVLTVQGNRRCACRGAVKCIVPRGCAARGRTPLRAHPDARKPLPADREAWIGLDLASVVVLLVFRSRIARDGFFGYQLWPSSVHWAC